MTSSRPARGEAPRSVRRVSGIPVQRSTLAEASRYVVQRARNPGRSPTHVHLLNAYSIALADKDQQLRTVFTSATANFADGRPLVWMSRMTVGASLSQVRGADLFRGVIREGVPDGIGHYLLGGSTETVRLLESALVEYAPGVRIVGRESPPYRALSDAELAAQDQRILSSGADIVWVGLGTPRQDFEGVRLAQSIPVVTVAVGAAFDFIAGTKREAPRLASSLGVEWIFRLLSEPRRLWKRYLFGNVRFVYAVLRNRRLD